MTSGNSTEERGRFLKCLRWNQVVITGLGCKFLVSASVSQKWLSQQSKTFHENMLLSENLLTKGRQGSDMALLCFLLGHPTQRGIRLQGFTAQYCQYFSLCIPRVLIPKVFQVNWHPSSNKIGENRKKFCTFGISRPWAVYVIGLFYSNGL